MPNVDIDWEERGAEMALDESRRGYREPYSHAAPAWGEKARWLNGYANAWRMIRQGHDYARGHALMVDAQIASRVLRIARS